MCIIEIIIIVITIIINLKRIWGASTVAWSNNNNATEKSNL